VVPTPPAYPDIDVSEHIRQFTEASQARLRELKAQLGVHAPHTVVDALLTDGIHHELVRRRADLLVTGRGHSIGTFSRMWSHLYSMIRDSPCPVLSI
jgi:nucleotide-binding universal stress UspA family protein